MSFDTNKEITAIKQELSSKLCKLASTGDVIEKYLEHSNIEISKEAKKLWKLYIDKFHKSSNIKNKEIALIKMYSNYKALKVVGKICQQILDKTNYGKKKLTENQIKEYLGALKVAELAKEQKKFELRVKSRRFGNEKEYVRLAEILSSTEKMSAINETTNKNYFCDTPFGEIRINCKFQNGYQTRMISAEYGDKEDLPYTTMATNLDNALSKLGETERNNFISCIKKYINQKVKFSNIVEDTQTVLNSLKIYGFVNRSKLSPDELSSAAVLCGCLLFAESSQVRNPTLGKWERKSIEKVERLIGKGCVNPFQVVFVGKSEEFSEEFGNLFVEDRNAYYTPAKSSPGNKKIYHKGGMRQADWLITGKADITRDILGNSESKSYLNLVGVLNKLSENAKKIVKDQITIKKQKFANLLNMLEKKKN